MNSRRFIALTDPKSKNCVSIPGGGCASQQKRPAYVRLGSFTSFPPSRRVRFAPKSRHSASAHVYEYTSWPAFLPLRQVEMSACAFISGLAGSFSNPVRFAFISCA